MSKADIRKELLQQRLNYSASVVDEQAVIKQLCQQVQLDNSDIIAGYWPVNGEVDIVPLLRELSSTHRTCLPKVHNPERMLRFHLFDEDRLAPGKCGILEPVDTPELTPNIILVPCVAVSQAGDRLGYGGGYYDYTIRQLRQASHKLTTVGVVYDFQVLPDLPTSVHDQRLDELLIINPDIT